MTFVYFKKNKENERTFGPYFCSGAVPRENDDIEFSIPKNDGTFEKITGRVAFNRWVFIKGKDPSVVVNFD